MRPLARGTEIITMTGISLPLCVIALLAPTNAQAQTHNWTVVSIEQTSLAPTADSWRAQQRHLTTASGDSFSLRRSIPLDTPLALSRPDTREGDLSVAWRHSWTAIHETSETGLEMSVSPHAGIDWDREGSTPVAGATLRVGRGLDRLAPDGDAVFGQKARWYLFASGSKRAVGYNFTRDREGGFSNEGLSRDLGQSAMGDAAIGVAWRRGPIQSTVGIAYREVEIDGLRGYGGRKTDVDEGVFAFQLSIRPQ